MSSRAESTKRARIDSSAAMLRLERSNAISSLLAMSLPRHAIGSSTGLRRIGVNVSISVTKLPESADLRARGLEEEAGVGARAHEAKTERQELGQELVVTDTRDPQHHVVCAARRRSV